MAEQRPGTGQPPRLRSVSPDTEGDTQGDTSAAPVPVSVSPAGVAPLSVAGHAGVGVRAMAGAVRDLWLRPGRLLYVMWHGKPESMAEHRAYMKSRAWVPPGMDGGAEKAVSIAGIAYHLIIARPLKAAAKTVDAAADRPLRLLCLAAFVLVLIVLLARYL